MRSRQDRNFVENGRSAFTLVELFVLIFVIALLIALLLPAMRTSSQARTRMQCANNLRQVGLALLQYHSHQNQFPLAMGGSSGTNPLTSNVDRLSGLVALLPYLELKPVWDEITQGTVPPSGPAPWISDFEPWRIELDELRCPSDPNRPKSLGMTNYTFCIGDMTQSIHAPTVARGAFACRLRTTLSEVTDGTSYTIALCEIATANDRELRGQFAVNQQAIMLRNPKACDQLRDANRPNHYGKSVALDRDGRGCRWADGAAGFALVNTILPPNSPSCAVGGMHAVDGVYSAGSNHEGGCQVVMSTALSGSSPTTSSVATQRTLL